MKSFLQYLFESKQKVAVFTFGRFQPPTIGHEKLVNQVLKTAQKEGGVPFVYVSRNTKELSKNPLPPKLKIQILRSAFPKKSIIDDPKAITPFHVLQILSDKKFNRVIFIVGDDRVAEFNKSIQNTINSRNPYSFSQVEVISAGERDPDGKGVVGVSGSKMREYAQLNDFGSFKKGFLSKVPDKLIQKSFQTIQKALNQ